MPVGGDMATQPDGMYSRIPCWGLRHWSLVHAFLQTTVSLCEIYGSARYLYLHCQLEYTNVNTPQPTNVQNVCDLISNKPDCAGAWVDSVQQIIAGSNKNKGLFIPSFSRQFSRWGWSHWLMAWPQGPYEGQHEGIRFDLHWAIMNTDLNNMKHNLDSNYITTSRLSFWKICENISN